MAIILTKMLFLMNKFFTFCCKMLGYQIKMSLNSKTTKNQSSWRIKFILPRSCTVVSQKFTTKFNKFKSLPPTVVHKVYKKYSKSLVFVHCELGELRLFSKWRFLHYWFEGDIFWRFSNTVRYVILAEALEDINHFLLKHVFTLD